MAKRKAQKVRSVRVADVASWNFVLFLVLAFILLVVLVSALTATSHDVRSKAGLECPSVSLPRPEDCPGTWKYGRDVTNGCPAFICEAAK